MRQRSTSPRPQPRPRAPSVPADVHIVFYSVDLTDLLDWIGCADSEREREAWALVQADEDSDWEPEELEVLQKLLHRVIHEGKLYDGLGPDERYYLTQLLMDLFDEYVDQEHLSEDLPLSELLPLLDEAPPAARPALTWLLRGRQLGGDGLIWEDGKVEDVLAYTGYLTTAEAASLVQALDGGKPASGARPARKPSRALRGMRDMAALCAESGSDLVSFIG